MSIYSRKRKKKSPKIGMFSSGLELKAMKLMDRQDFLLTVFFLFLSLTWSNRWQHHLRIVSISNPSLFKGPSNYATCPDLKKYGESSPDDKMKKIPGMK